MLATLQFLRGLVEAVAIWALLAAVGAEIFRGTRDWSDAFVVALFLLGLVQIVYLLPIALTVAGRGNTSRAVGMILSWAVALIYFFWTFRPS